MRRITYFLVLTLFVCLVTRGVSLADRILHELAPGVEYVQEVLGPPSGPLVINMLRVDLKRSGVRVKAALGQDVVFTDGPAQGREPLGALAARQHALAAINGDFFPFSGDPLNLGIRDGELFSESMPHRAVIGLGKNGEVVIDNLLTIGSLYAADNSLVPLDGINRPVGQDELVVLTPTFGQNIRCSERATIVELADVGLPVRAGQELTGKASDPIPGHPKRAIPMSGVVLTASGSAAEWLKSHVHAGDAIRFRFDLVTNPLPPGPYRGNLPSRAGLLRGRSLKSVWTDIDQAIGGGPWLVRDGKVAVDADEEKFDRSFVSARNPRTGAGVSATGELLMLTVDGRQPHSRGMSLQELAEYLIQQGAVNAINLDGGGSSSMVVKDLYVNGPSDGGPRPIADAMLVFQDDTAAAAPLVPIDVLTAISLKAGESRSILLPLQTGTAGTGQPVFGTIDGRGFVSQKGALTGTHTGSGMVVAKTAGCEFHIPFTIEAGPPAKVAGFFSASPNNPPDRTILTLKVSDSFGNGIADQLVKVQTKGGMAERDTMKTDTTGKASIEIVWDVDVGREVTITSGILGAITVKSK